MNFQFDQTSITWIIVSGFFIASFLIQMFYYLYFYLRIYAKNSPGEIVNSGEPVSVVICARNEVVNLGKNLPFILEQEYPDYEVIVVNDCSEDDTDELLERLMLKYKNLRHTRIKKDLKFRHGKKLALTIGLKAAKNDWVLLTDADCRPASSLWISHMQKHFVSPYEIVLGYGGYEREDGLLNKLIRYDAFFIALQYFSFAMAGHPYMGVGRNLAYKRSLFFKNKGFASHLGLESGDDDLFINEVATKSNTAIEISHDAHTYSIPHRTWKGWFKQKCRHLTTGFHYKGPTKFLLGLENTSRLVFYLSLVALIINMIFLPYVLAIFLIRLLSGVIILNIGMNRLNEKKLLVFSPIFDLIFILFNLSCVISNYFIQKRSRWR
ncbi:MAG: glycosyltransferase [Bacteroidales bacterium]